MTVPERPWLQPGKKVARVRRGGTDREAMILVTVLRLTATQVVVEDPTSGEEERFRLKDLRLIRKHSAWEPVPELADPACEEVREAAARLRLRRLRDRVQLRAAKAHRAAGDGVEAETAALDGLIEAVQLLRSTLKASS